MRFFPPNDMVGIYTKHPRWIRDWARERSSLNVTGLIREKILEEMKQVDPLYYEENKHKIKNHSIQKRETTIRQKMIKV